MATRVFANRAETNAEAQCQVEVLEPDTRGAVKGGECRMSAADWRRHPGLLNRREQETFWRLAEEKKVEASTVQALSAWTRAVGAVSIDERKQIVQRS